MGFIHRYIPAPSANSRILLLLHGTGGNENDMLPLGRRIDPRAAVLSPRGNVLENGMPRFFRRFAEGVFDEEDVVRRAGELAQFVELAASHYGFDAARVTAVGYSNGANIAAAVLLLTPDTFASAILLRAMRPLGSPPAPHLSHHAILISNGANDPIIPADEGEQLAELFRRGAAEVTLAVQRAGHNLVQQDVTSAQQFYRRLI